MKFGNPRGKAPIGQANKGSRQEMLPSRMALARLTKGDPMQRSLGNYAKATPSGAGAMTTTYDQLTAMGLPKDNG
jgi:hypothetical protein